MPKFELVAIEDAVRNTATMSKRQKVLMEYVGFIEQLAEGQAGRLEATDGETSGAVRRRLGAAAKMVNKELAIKRMGDEVYFWLAPRKKVTRRRGRPKKNVGEATQ